MSTANETLVLLELWIDRRGREAFNYKVAVLKNQTAQADGLVAIDRYENMIEEGRILLLSTWRDRESARQWRRRNLGTFLRSMEQSGHLARAQIRVASIIGK